MKKSGVPQCRIMSYHIMCVCILYGLVRLGSNVTFWNRSGSTYLSNSGNKTHQYVVLTLMYYCCLLASITDTVLNFLYCTNVLYSYYHILCNEVVLVYTIYYLVLYKSQLIVQSHSSLRASLRHQ